MGNVIIGSARIDEHGKLQGGTKGDQKQTATPDYKGEVSMQPFYNHSKGWYIIRLKDARQAVKLAEAMRTACNNPNIGYDQARRTDALQYGTGAKVKTACDCSSLVRLCFKEATGVDPGNFTTYNERSVLKKTGLVMDAISYAKGLTLYAGDILVTKTKGHTVVVVDGESRDKAAGVTDITSKADPTTKSLTDVAREVIAGKHGNGAARRASLAEAGYPYSYAMIQAEVARLMGK